MCSGNRALCCSQSLKSENYLLEARGEQSSLLLDVDKAGATIWRQLLLLKCCEAGATTTAPRNQSDASRAEELQREQNILRAMSTLHVVWCLGLLGCDMFLEHAAGGSLADEIKQQECDQRVGTAQFYGSARDFIKIGSVNFRCPPPLEICRTLKYLFTISYSRREKRVG
jgi:hypothetical protein